MTIYKNRWKQKKTIASGGSGKASICIDLLDKNEKEYIIKTLTQNKTDKILRFDNEITILKSINHKGVIRLIDSCSADEITKWYVMPKCESIIKMMDDYSYENSNDSPSFFTRVILKNILFLFKTLKYIHSNNIFHRDIKPENIVFFNNRSQLIDFGIAKNTQIVNDLTMQYDKNGLGAKFYLSPEMKRNPLTADLVKADIYSLTKTLWACLTGEYKSFDGQYHRETCNFLKYERAKLLSGHNENYLEILHNFFEKNTSNNFNEVMSIDESIKELDSFIFLTNRYGRNSYFFSLDSECAFLLKNYFKVDLKEVNSIKINFKQLSEEFIKIITLIIAKEYTFFQSNTIFSEIDFFNSYLENRLNNTKEKYLDIDFSLINNEFSLNIKTTHSLYKIKTELYI